MRPAADLFTHFGVKLRPFVELGAEGGSHLEAGTRLGDPAQALRPVRAAAACTVCGWLRPEPRVGPCPICGAAQVDAEA